MSRILARLIRRCPALWAAVMDIHLDECAEHRAALHRAFGQHDEAQEILDGRKR